ncbi:hypothetical protein P154DRAFT_534080 [Amniculicola lignicola CBS 123094]|uniref:Cellular morphogenesis protein n=1 Tax=Amniculicola lignicola CBS 123094 TaxID=1392246 RepID=A0A6A5WIG2_9PLEO|nr:hypothetical protein P154DRAFT_534080 [Amniculicola lignicola CBS 123094]
MRALFSSSLRSRAGTLFTAALLLARTAGAFNFTSIPSPNLKLSDLGRVAFVGDFDSISLYEYEGQNEGATGSNGALLTRFPNGVFTTLNETDADIKTMCAFRQNGTLQGIVFGGNFTSVGSQHTPGGIAMLNPADGTVTPLEGLNGSVNALFCDDAGGRVYIGGSFSGGGASNAIVWITEWTNMPFSGFNGPVNSILQAPNGNIIFGGEFNGLGDNSTAPQENNTQVIPIASASITAQTSSGLPGFTEPRNIVCNSGNSQGAGSTWLLSDNAPGFWRADFGFGFQPSKLRLTNTNFDGRGTKTWRFTALPDGGIMNFTYVDPSTKQRAFCDARCPLPQDNITAQDFYFVNNVGMNSFRVDISDWYGAGGGLNGLQLFQNDIYSFAINEFNQPSNASCSGATTSATSTQTGPWAVTPSHDSNAQYLTAVLQTPEIAARNVSVVFQPDIPQSGNYSVLVYTPGCIGDGTCSTRGRVNITGSWAEGQAATRKPFEIFQTNNFDKYDEIYMGYIDKTNGFRPSVTLTPSTGQTGPLTVVAQRVGFKLITGSSGNLNGIFEYNPSMQEVDADLSKSTFNAAGASLSPRDQAIITSFAKDSKRVFVGGNFSGDGLNNFFAITDTNATSVSGNGLNSQVMTMYQNGSTIYVGGNFTNTQDNKTPNLNGVATFNTDNDSWRALGAGVEGVVMYIVPFSLNITANVPEQVLAISGVFNRVNAFGNNTAFSTENFAVWVPSRQNWLQNLNLGTISIQGALMAFVNVPGSDPIFAGSISSQSLGARGAVALEGGSPPSLEAFPMSIRPQQVQSSSVQKRATTGDRNDTTTGIVTAIVYKDNNMNKTILAGHFAATGSDGSNITNLLIIDGNDGNKMTGFHDELNSDSTFKALGALNGILYAGGSISGTIKNSKVAGLVAYDLASNGFTSGQPPALQGTNVTVNAIAPRPTSKDVYVAGGFESAGALSCPSLCIWSSERSQWLSPGGDLSGIVTSITWISNTKLLVAGNLTVGNNQTKIVTYDSSKSQFQEFTGAGDLPGPVTAMTVATEDGNQIWVTGQATDGSAYLQRYDGDKWVPVNNIFGQGTIVRGIQVLSLSESHEKIDLIDQEQDLLLLGQINVTNFGTASAVLFNGTTLQPFLLSSTADNQPGSLSQVFVENPQFFLKRNSRELALGWVVLISLACALALTFLVVVAGILLEWYRKKHYGYNPAPTTFPDRTTVNRLPPEHLFGTLGGNRAPAI